MGVRGGVRRRPAEPGYKGERILAMGRRVGCILHSLGIGKRTRPGRGGLEAGANHFVLEPPVRNFRRKIRTSESC